MEFDHIFSDLFDCRASLYIDIVKNLVNGPRSVGDLIQENKSWRRDTLQRALHDLMQAGFVTQDCTWSLHTAKASWLIRYRLSDNYLRFYLRYILPARPRITLGTYKPTTLPGWDGIMGLQFENLVLNNVLSLAPHIGVCPEDILYYGPFFQRQNQRQQGCQIDLLIHTRHRILIICEIKFRTLPIGMEVIKEVEHKLQRLLIPRGISIQPVLVHVNGVTAPVEQEEFFAHIVDFSELLST